MAIFCYKVSCRGIACVIIAVSLIAWILQTYGWFSPPINKSDSELLEETVNLVYAETNPRISAIDFKGKRNDSQEPQSRTEEASRSHPQQVQKYLMQIAKAQKEALYVLESDSNWSKQMGNSEGDGIVYSKATEKWGTVYKLEATIDISAKVMFYDMINKSEDVPKWNPTMLKVKVIQRLDECSEIAYSVSASAGGGWVSSRDFVYVRHWERLNGWYVTSSVSVTYPSLTANPKYVRGRQRPSIIRMRDVAPHKLRVQWLLNTDIKGNIPTFFVQRAMSGTLISYLKHLKKHALSLL